MYERVDVYVKRGEWWVYLEGTRMHQTLKAARTHYAAVHGLPVKCKFAERS